MSAIQLDSLSKQYGESFAVRDVSLTVPQGCFTALLGPSGCGKSTTLRLIAGLDTPTAGRVCIDGKDVTSLAPAQRRLSMVFQSYALFPHLTVRENILFGLRVRKEPTAGYEPRVKRVAALLGLDALLARRPAQLSGGQQQRVALARAVISEAPVCLMDEPLSNLDAQLRHEMRREIRALQQSLGMTMVYVTHDQTEAMSMADEVVLMRAGQVEQHATPDALYGRPATPFCARFIGTPPMNILTLDTMHGVLVIAGQHGPAIPTIPAAPAIPDTPAISARPAISDTPAMPARPAMPAATPSVRTVQLGIRPEHIRLAPAGHAATIESVEYFGADSILNCTMGQNRGVAVRVAGHARANKGDAIHLTWDSSHQHVFAA